MEPTVEIVPFENGVVQQLTRGEAETQTALAKRYPRNPQLSMRKIVANATASPQIAAACFYALPRGGKTIEGPSVRLAEIAARHWGNVKAGARIIDVGETHVTAQGVAWDLESNYSFSIEVRRRITDRHGKRFNDDMIGVTSNAAASIAYREAVIKLIGRTELDPIWQQCRAVSIGESRSLSDQWQAALSYWAKAGVDEPRLLAALGKTHKAQVDQDDIVKMRGFTTALRDGDTTLDELFPPAEKTVSSIVPPSGRQKMPQKSSVMAQESTENHDRVSGPPNDTKTAQTEAQAVLEEIQHYDDLPGWEDGNEAGF